MRILVLVKSKNDIIKWYDTTRVEMNAVRIFSVTTWIFSLNVIV